MFNYDRTAAAYSQPAIHSDLPAGHPAVHMPGPNGEDVLQHARYKSNPPIQGYNVLLTKAVRHMTPDQARAVADDLVRMADYAEALRDARVNLKR